MPSEFAQKIVDMLSPSIGKFMALKLVNAACEMAQLNVEEVEKKDQKVVCEHLEAACVSFGKQIAKSIRERAEELE